MNIGIVCGEPSGDILGASLIHALRAQQLNLHFTGVAGPNMHAAGCHSLFNIDRLSVMGLIEPIKHLPELFRIRSKLVDHFTQQKPDVFVGIDYPGFNLSLEARLHKKGIPIVHYVSPSVWAWHRSRIHPIKKNVNLMLTLFPFEADFYREHQVPVCFVGHPLADHIPLQSDKLAARRALDLDPDAIYIAVLPGSRKSEIKHIGPTFLAAAEYCFKKNPNLRFITSAIHAGRDAEYQAQYHSSSARNIPMTFFINRSHEVMAASDVILVTSGTATLEAMLFKKPMVIGYRMENITYQIARHLVKVPYIGIPNLLANECIVPEFIQGAATAKNLGEAVLDYLDHPEKISILEKKFLQLHETLRCNASQRAAEAILKFCI